MAHGKSTVVKAISGVQVTMPFVIEFNFCVFFENSVSIFPILALIADVRISGHIHSGLNVLFGENLVSICIYMVKTDCGHSVWRVRENLLLELVSLIHDYLFSWQRFCFRFF